MVDLSVEFCGFKFRNPVILASGYPTGNIGSGQTLKMMAEAGAGGITARSVFVDKVDVGLKLRPKYGIDGHDLVHFDAIYETASEFFGKQAEISKVEGVPLIASILGKSVDDFRILGEMADKCDPVDIIEVNVSCPGTEHFNVKIDMVRPNVSQMPELVEEILRTVRDTTSKPLIAKLSAQADNMAETARAAVAGGANAIAGINTLPNTLAAIDIETGKPGLPILGAFGGAGLRHLAMGAVVQIRKAVSVPVLGIGGVFTWQDVVEMIMAGASLVGMATAPLLRGAAIFEEIIPDLEKFMESHGYTTVDDMCGIALPHVYTLEDVPEFDLVANIDIDECTSCGTCLEVCAYGAIELEPEPVVIEDNCVACSLCRNICPSEAVSLTSKSRK
jgi:dihydroorotate dehydrogenase subfamily 1